MSSGQPRAQHKMILFASRLICISVFIPFLLLFTCFLQNHATSAQSHLVCDQKKFYFEKEMESFVPVPTGSDFPIQNLPYGVFTTPGQVIIFICSRSWKVSSNGKKFNSLRSISVSPSETTFWIWPLSLVCIQSSCKMLCVLLCWIRWWLWVGMPGKWYVKSRKSSFWSTLIWIGMLNWNQGG